MMVCGANVYKKPPVRARDPARRTSWRFPRPVRTSTPARLLGRSKRTVGQVKAWSSQTSARAPRTLARRHLLFGVACSLLYRPQSAHTISAQKNRLKPLVVWLDTAEGCEETERHWPGPCSCHHDRLHPHGQRGAGGGHRCAEERRGPYQEP